MSAPAAIPAIKAAMSVAKDLAEGQLAVAQLDAEVAARCRDLFGLVAGEGDPLWELHVDVARQAVALGALSADELAEWTAVIRQAEGKPVQPAAVSWIEQALAAGAADDDEAGA